MDELGCAEKDIGVFTSKVYELLDSSKLVFGVLKDADCAFLNSIRSRQDVKVVRIDEVNRDYILKDLVDFLKVYI